MACIRMAICFEETGWLAHIIVGAAYRSRGIGRQLLISLMSFVSRSHLTCIAEYREFLGFRAGDPRRRMIEGGRGQAIFECEPRICVVLEVLFSQRGEVALELFLA